ncbi:MAG: SEL1-like repeat protein [Acidaminococcaceae bacterium]|nr:SEL1-like repeat protein [Acidaminococcaceae bacterium]
MGTCERCGFEYEGYYVHCPNCGSIMDTDDTYTFQCANCLRFVPDNAKRCPYCGIEFPKTEGTRRPFPPRTKASNPTVYEDDIIQLAKRATPELQTKLGLLYEEADSDYITAYKLFLMAAEKDYAPAMVKIGDCYNDLFDCEDDDEYQVDYEKAFQWYSKAAALGDAEGQYNLGKCYYDGTGVEENKRKAVYWFKKSANQNYVKACEFLGDCYKYAYGVNKDIWEAAKWYEIAVKKDSVHAIMELGLLYYDGDDFIKDYEKAYNLLSKLEGKNTNRFVFKRNKRLTGSAFAALGDCYYFGRGTQVNYKQAIKLFEIAADAGSDYALYSLGICYEYGRGVEKNKDSLKKAFGYYKKAADNGDIVSQNKVGKMHLNGEGIEKDLKEALSWYMKAAINGNADAQYSLGKMYANGDGVDRDLNKALDWYLCAAGKKHAGAQYEVGEMYYYGLGVDKNRVVAVTWFKKAADNGSVEAKEFLKSISK